MIITNFSCPLHGRGALLGVHGRHRGTPKKRRAGAADLGQIRQVAEALRIPVLANGNVRQVSDVRRNLGGGLGSACGGYMCAEAVLRNPGIFEEVKGLDGGAAGGGGGGGSCGDGKAEGTVAAMAARGEGLRSKMGGRGEKEEEEEDGEEGGTGTRKNDTAAFGEGITGGGIETRMAAEAETTETEAAETEAAETEAEAETGGALNECGATTDPLRTHGKHPQMLRLRGVALEYLDICAVHPPPDMQYARYHIHQMLGKSRGGNRLSYKYLGGFKDAGAEHAGDAGDTGGAGGGGDGGDGSSGGSNSGSRSTAGGVAGGGAGGGDGKKDGGGAMALREAITSSETLEDLKRVVVKAMPLLPQ